MQKLNWVCTAVCLVGLTGAVVGCDDDKKMDQKSDMHMHSGMKSDMKMGKADPNSLYMRLGGEPAITAVCDDFVGRAASDPKVNFFRKGVPGAKEWQPTPEELATFKKHLVQFVEMAAGGPQMYEGRDMKTVHKGMKITSSEFDALAADLSASLDKFNVPAREKGELLSAVAGTKKDIVEKPNM